MSAARILVLGVVRKEGQAHGYQVRRELLRWRADLWAKIAPGSIYQALRTLSKHGLLDEVGTEAGEGGPERTVYRISPDGETELLHLIRLALTEPDRGSEMLNAAFAFLDLLARDEVPGLFAYRVRSLSAKLVEIDPPTEAEFAADAAPPQVEALRRLYAAKLRVDADWSMEMAERIRDGAYVFAGERTNQL